MVPVISSVIGSLSDEVFRILFPEFEDSRKKKEASEKDKKDPPEKGSQKRLHPSKNNKI